jgi:hypothetical protein
MHLASRSDTEPVAVTEPPTEDGATNEVESATSVPQLSPDEHEKMMEEIAVVRGEIADLRTKLKQKEDLVQKMEKKVGITKFSKV